MSQEASVEFTLPPFIPGRVVRETPNYRVVTDWKPGRENQDGGERFYIEPKTKEAEQMLKMAALIHHIANFNEREVTVGEEVVIQQCLRADYITGNLPSLLYGKTERPGKSEDTIPSPDRLEECLAKHPSYYSFVDK
jgi:hypothetical protein